MENINKMKHCKLFAASESRHIWSDFIWSRGRRGEKKGKEVGKKQVEAVMWQFEVNLKNSLKILV